MWGWIEWLRAHALELPLLAKFAIGLGLIVIVPALSRRVHLPSVVGLLLSGVVFGPYGLELIGTQRPIPDFFGEIGKLLLMFTAGLEVDLDLFRRVKSRSMTFGVITTFTPLILGTCVGLAFHYSLLASIVIGSLLASHTLLASYVVTRLRLTKLEPMNVVYGATLFSDTSSLIVFALCLSTFVRGFSLSGIVIQILEIGAFVGFVLFGLGRLGGFLLRKMDRDEDAYFATMLAILSIAAVLADVIKLPGIVGAFLSGLALNQATQKNAAKQRLEFFATSFFIPIFFITTGFLIDPRALAASLTRDYALVAAIIGALVIGKYLAAEIAGRRFGYTRDERLTMWSLTLPQVAATLAATLVAYNTFDGRHQRLLDTRMLNVVLALMLFTSILGPILTEHFAPRLTSEAAAAHPEQRAA